LLQGGHFQRTTSVKLKLCPDSNYASVALVARHRRAGRPRVDAPLQPPPRPCSWIRPGSHRRAASPRGTGSPSPHCPWYTRGTRRASGTTRSAPRGRTAAAAARARCMPRSCAVRGTRPPPRRPRRRPRRRGAAGARGARPPRRRRRRRAARRRPPRSRRRAARRRRGGSSGARLPGVKRTDVMGCHASGYSRDALPLGYKTGQRGAPSGR